MSFSESLYLILSILSMLEMETQISKLPIEITFAVILAQNRGTGPKVAQFCDFVAVLATLILNKTYIMCKFVVNKY